ncbi:hypothetical protein IG631_14965 [Alternaria alternata]|jgi:hypothetical protein|nr:hypothetical protein IG631_14965 [Alternaria alternata]
MLGRALGTTYCQAYYPALREATSYNLQYIIILYVASATITITEYQQLSGTAIRGASVLPSASDL